VLGVSETTGSPLQSLSVRDLRTPPMQGMIGESREKVGALIEQIL